MSESFVSQDPQLEDYWRGIILFGRNVASYKFALAKSLLELRPQSGQFISLEELAEPFSLHVSEHLRKVDRQGTFPSSRFLDACRDFNQAQITQDDLIAMTVRLGFNNVIDAFHVVGRGEIPHRFFTDERKGQKSKGIRITDEFSILSETDQMGSLPAEVEARWRLVETAWSQGIARNLLRIDYDVDTEGLFALDRQNRRTPVTSSRDALNGYQKGKCFYCRGHIGLYAAAENPDVDHFFPHVLKSQGFGPLVDGVWNLVLACQQCNRGVGGKFDAVPTVKYLERLHTRNEYLISSHHPLRETLIQQTGKSEEARRGFLQDWHNSARATLLHQWEPVDVREEDF